MDCIVNQLERVIHGITLTGQMRFTNEFCTHIVEFEAWWYAIVVRKLRKTIQQCEIHFGHPRWILWATYQSQFAEWVLAILAPLIFLAGYISAIWTRYVDLPTKSTTFNRCSSKVTGVLVLTMWRRHGHILPFKAGMILTLQKISTYYQLQINSKICTEPIFDAFTIVKKCHFSAPYHNRFIIWVKLMSVACAKVSNWPLSEMHL